MNIDVTIDPLEIVEDLAESVGWGFERTGESEACIAVKSLWKGIYQINFQDDTEQSFNLLLCVSFDCKDSAVSMLEELHTLLNSLHGQEWWGNLSFLIQDGELVFSYKYGLMLNEDDPPTMYQIDSMVKHAVGMMDFVYPALMAIMSEGATAEEAQKYLIGQSYGRA